jgi:hypothetical protein
VTPKDWEISAYDAALRDDEDGVYASVRQINTYGRTTVENALKSWMLRTKYVLMCLASAANRPVAFVVEMHDCNGDQAKIDPEVAWAGQLFAAYIADDGDQWDTLLGALPDDPDDVADLLRNVLTMLAVVASSANEDLSLHVTPDGPTPMLRSARLARAHLN